MGKDLIDIEIDALRMKIKGQQGLLIAYRTGTRPTEKTFRLLDQSDKLIKEYGFKEC
jgi:hypothetical protein